MKFLNLVLLNTIIVTFVLQAQKYKVVDTRVHTFYNDSAVISEPQPGTQFFGQDASYQGNEPSYTDNGDGTITDNVTGLMWQKDMGDKITAYDANTKADTMTLGGHTDWRVPTIKELYSLILFTGRVEGMNPVKKFIDTNYFNQPVGNTAIGERLIDAQTWSSTQYNGITMQNDTAIFGVNFIDGRIKGYPKWTNSKTAAGRVLNKMYFRMVRGNTDYGKNQFVNNNDGTISDNATGLMWQQADNGSPVDWKEALSYAENLVLAGYTDWRLPNAKELQSIVDYTRCPSATNSPAIDPMFSTTMINDPAGIPGHYPYFWSSTSHLETTSPYTQGVYIAFGKALGKMNGVLLDVHGAGAQRSDPKTGDPANYPQFMGPQGDARIVFNFARCVRNFSGATIMKDDQPQPKEYILSQNYPNPFNSSTLLSFHTIKNGFVSLRVVDPLGREIALLMNEYKPAGIYKLAFQADNLASGVYYYSLTTADFSETRKMIVLK